jgi:pyruvate formate lyase activating enzyme
LESALTRKSRNRFLTSFRYHPAGDRNIVVEEIRMPSGTVFDIKKFAIHDGPGIRTTVFLKGCPLDCWWCHNPEGRRSDPELMPGAGKDDGPVAVGTVMTVAQVMAEIEKDGLFYDESGGGVTFSGGEPLLQPDFIAALVSCCRGQGIHTALDTTGYAAPEIVSQMAPLVDLFLYDLKIMDENRHQTYTGVSNADILKNLRYLANTGRKVTIRFPMIPGINDTPENLNQMMAFLNDLNLKQIDLLPYHRLHQTKYHRLGFTDRLKDLPPPGEDAIAHLTAHFTTAGFSVRVGG